MTCAHVSLRSGLDALHTANERWEGVLRDFLEKVYRGLMRTHAASYRNWLNVLLSDAQLRGEYVGGYLIRISENCYSLSIDEATSDEVRSDQRSALENGDNDIIEVVPSAKPLPPLQYSFFIFLSPAFVYFMSSSPFCFGYITNKDAQILLNYIALCSGFLRRKSVLIWAGRLFPDSVLQL